MAGKTGYTALLTIGTYTGAELVECGVEINHEPVEVTDLADAWRDYAAGLRSWSVTGRKYFISQAFLHLARSGATSVAVKITVPSGTTSTVVLSGVGFVTQGSLSVPHEAMTESITVTGKGAPTKPT